MARKNAPTTAPVRHRPTVERGVGTVGRVHRMLCTCGERGRDWSVRSMADRDVTLHLMDLPRVPANDRCRDERRHDRRPWEPCEVCADQLPLFDLEVTR
ncbi:hypothetical protein [Streptosporangium longisporum]|uniref:Uncharacterized protein n=1 Tax=Streptosporangium longisporum TaxID=46187 RepID=A0ABP6LDK0_9ACTN